MKKCENCVHLFDKDSCNALLVSLRKRDDGSLIASPRCSFVYYEEIQKVEEPTPMEKPSVAPKTPKILDDSASLFEELKEKNEVELKTPPKKPVGRPKTATTKKGTKKG